MRSRLGEPVARTRFDRRTPRRFFFGFDRKDLWGGETQVGRKEVGGDVLGVGSDGGSDDGSDVVGDSTKKKCTREC